MGDTIILKSNEKGEYDIKGTESVVVVEDGGIGVILNKKKEETYKAIISKI